MLEQSGAVALANPLRSPYEASSSSNPGEVKASFACGTTKGVGEVTKIGLGVEDRRFRTPWARRADDTVGHADGRGGPRNGFANDLPPCRISPQGGRGVCPYRTAGGLTFQMFAGLLHHFAFIKWCNVKM